MRKNKIKSHTQIKDKKKLKIKIWKIVAIAVIAIFAILLIKGFMRAHDMRAAFIKPTQAQINTATKIAAEKLESIGGNASLFEIRAGEMMRRHPDKRFNGEIMQISFYNDETMHIFLVDMSTEKAILHSQTDIYEMPDLPKYGRNFTHSGEIEMGEFGSGPMRGRP